MFDAAPLLMLANDPDQLSQPGLELLGVAHRGCADLARQRLEARQVKLPDDLPQLVADEGALNAGLVDALQLHLASVLLRGEGARVIRPSAGAGRQLAVRSLGQTGLLPSTSGH